MRQSLHWGDLKLLVKASLWNEETLSVIKRLTTIECIECFTETHAKNLSVELTYLPFINDRIIPVAENEKELEK